MPAKRHPARRRPPALGGVAAALALALLAGCGGSGGSEASEPTESPSASPSATDETSGATEAPEAPASPSPTASEEAAGLQVELDLTGGGTPEAQSVEVAAGEPVTLVIRADAAGELHVHSTPEQDVDYGPGRTEQELVLDRPGVVDVESHDLGVVLARLEVR